MKILNKLVLTTFASLLLVNAANAQTTVCYKNNWDTPSTIENTPLNGDVCEGKFSLADMKKDGWSVVDIKIDSEQNKLNYKYFLVKNSGNEINNVTRSTTNGSKFSIRPIGVKLENIANNKSTINVGNLPIGSSGIVVHVYDNDKRLIVSNAKVIESNDTNSVVEFFEFNDLKQEALPTSNRVVEKNDILVLNYMYPASLVIAPTQETFQIVRSNFKYNNFLHSDLFAAQLKIEGQPYPSKEDIQKFAIEQNLGTIFIVVDQKVNVLDAKTFAKLADYTMTYNEDDNTQMPFYTRVEEIESSLLNFDFSLPSLPKFINEKIPFIDSKNTPSDYKSNYENYYKYIIGLN